MLKQISKRTIKWMLRHCGYEVRRVMPAPVQPEPGSEDRELYLQCFGADAVANRRFYNIGSSSFRHLCWSNVDHPSAWYASTQQDNIHIAWDISTLQPIKVASGTAHIVYTSHTIEHLMDEHVAHMFKEAYRILKNGGVMRVTCPEILVYYEAYKRMNPHLCPYGAYYPNFSIQDLFLNEFASQFSRVCKAGTPNGAAEKKFSDAEFDHIFASRPLEQALDFFTKQCDYKMQEKAPGAHINWWHFEKIKTFLEAAGFRKIWKSSYGQSFCPPLRNVAFFDNTSPKFSVYVEAEK